MNGDYCRKHFLKGSKSIEIISIWIWRVNRVRLNVLGSFCFKCCLTPKTLTDTLR
ncbi:unnamed protein product [Gulo gulo]|uniref:Uncharacterized protein n=1 Tax=Gulo gulo TaxID=48420 RepID=A0A9X9M9T0_GULGU|nr:unnamed protein product [Gulo gulo]